MKIFVVNFMRNIVLKLFKFEFFGFVWNLEKKKRIEFNEGKLVYMINNKIYLFIVCL